MSTALDKTIARADEFLKRFRDQPVAHLIDGKQDPGNGQTFETHSPIDNSVIAKVARGGAAEIDKAARAATKAFRTGWSKTTGDERKKILHRIADAIEARADEIALIDASIPASPSATCRRRRCAARRISASTPTARRARMTACRCRPTRISTTPSASRSVPWA
jgi:hypothetical protein